MSPEDETFQIAEMNTPLPAPDVLSAYIQPGIDALCERIKDDLSDCLNDR